MDSALLLQLGEELVAKRSVAMGELIKNAYDADASNVIVEFKGVSRKGGEISVLDDGTGIPFAKLQNTWMRIATSEKQDRPISELFGRPRAGEKGIGRFATRRLAEELEIITTAFIDPREPARGKEETRIHFVWADFQIGKDIQAVPVRYQRSPVPQERASGTLLRLLRTREEWTADDVEKLRRDLVRLISPLPGSTRKRPGAKRADPGFDIILEFPDSELGRFAGTLSRDFLEHAYAVLKGDLSGKGEARYVLQFRDRGRQKQLTYTASAKFPSVGEAAFKVHFFPARSEFYKDKDFSTRSIAAVSREHGGIGITYDGFRVPPYGEEGNDWLKLDHDRARRTVSFSDDLRRLAGASFRPMLLLPGSNQLFGLVALSRFDNQDIRQLANREGLRQNDAFQQLQRFVRKGIDWLTVMYARHTEERRREDREARQGELQSPRALLSRAQQLIQELGEDTAPEHRKEAGQAIGLAIEAIKEQEADQIGELQMLRVLASTGTMIVVFDHQLIGILNRLRASYQTLDEFREAMPAAEQDVFGETLDDLKESIADAEHQGELLGLLLGRSARSRKRRLAIRPIVDRIAKAFAGYMCVRGMTFSNGVPAHVRTPPMFECELSAILINLLTNAMKAVRSSQVRKIEVTADRDRGRVQIRVKDTGVGAERSKWKEFFEPFYSESDPDPVLGTGTGLGLKIVADFVDVYGGTASFRPPDEPWKTCVALELPEN